MCNIWEAQEQFLWNKDIRVVLMLLVLPVRKEESPHNSFFLKNTPEQFGVLISCSGRRMRRSLWAQRNVPPSVLCDCMAEMRMRSLNEEQDGLLGAPIYDEMLKQGATGGYSKTCLHKSQANTGDTEWKGCPVAVLATSWCIFKLKKLQLKIS